MKKLLLYMLMSGLLSTALAQYSRDVKVNHVVQQVPASATLTTAGIAHYFNEQLPLPEQKLEAIHAWVSANIRYDTDSATIINWNADPTLKVTAALRRRKGVCENYTAIFHDIASQCGLLTVEVEGYTRQHGSIDRSGHSWLAVQVNNDWRFCDPTWDKDSRGQFNYFLVPPNQLIQSHMPFDYMWQLLTYPISHREFSSGNTSKGKNSSPYHFRDSIAAFLAMDSMQQLLSRQQRIAATGPANDLVALNASAVNMKIRIIQETQMELLYNDAVSNFNKGLNGFNDYLLNNHKGAGPGLIKDKLQRLTTLEEWLTRAKQSVQQLELMYNNFQYDPVVLKERISSLEGRIRKERALAAVVPAGK